MIKLENNKCGDAELGVPSLCDALNDQCADMDEILDHVCTILHESEGTSMTGDDILPQIKEAVEGYYKDWKKRKNIE